MNIILSINVIVYFRVEIACMQDMCAIYVIMISTLSISEWKEKVWKHEELRIKQLFVKL